MCVLTRKINMINVVGLSKACNANIKQGGGGGGGEAGFRV